MNTPGVPTPTPALLLPGRGAQHKREPPNQEQAEGNHQRSALGDLNRWYVSFRVPPQAYERKPTGVAVGIDMGPTAPTSSGNHLVIPAPFGPG